MCQYLPYCGMGIIIYQGELYKSLFTKWGSKSVNHYLPNGVAGGLIIIYH